MQFAPIGVLVNTIATFTGGIVGTFLGGYIPERVKSSLSLIFGLCSMLMGVGMIVKMNSLPPVVLSIILGTAFGELIRFEAFIGACAHAVKGPLDKVLPNKTDIPQDEFMEKFIAILILFSASGTGVFGSLQSGMTGDHTILFAKSILDFFTGAIFATTLGLMVSTIAVPQFLIMISLFVGAGYILPMTDAVMLANFNAVGGAIMLATGLRICGIKVFPIANMLPAMFIIMPITAFWAHIVKLIG